jgi:hypothetical protein
LLKIEAESEKKLIEKTFLLTKVTDDLESYVEELKFQANQEESEKVSLLYNI